MPAQETEKRFADLRQVLLVGTVLDPDLRYTPGGLAILTATLAGMERKGGEERVFYTRIKAFGKLAERMVDVLQTGRGAFVEGQLSHTEWEGREGRRERLEVIARQIEVFEPAPETLTDRNGQLLLSDGAVNEVSLTGRLVTTPELRYTPTGTALTRLRVAFNDTKRGHYATVQAWGPLAEALFHHNPQKGDRVAAIGRLVTRSYTDGTGAKRYETLVEARQAIIAQRFEAKPTPQAEAVPANAADPLEDFPPEEDLPF